MKTLLLIGAILLLLPCCYQLENCMVTQVPNAPEGYQLRKLGSFPNKEVIEMQFLNEQTGFLLSQNKNATCEILKTQNAGADWSPIGTPDETFSARDIHFVTPQKGYLVCNGNDTVPTFFETVNGGQDWTRREFPESPTRIQQLKTAENGDLYVKIAGAGYRSRFVKIYNGGTDTKLLMELGSFEGSILTVEEERLYIFDWPEILVFDLEGSLLESRTVDGIPNTLNSFQIIDDQHWILNAGSRALISSDGGQSWSKINSKGGKVFRFDSPQEGLMALDQGICGDYPDNVHTLAYTVDGGNTWTESERIHGGYNSIIAPCGLGPGHHLFFIESSNRNFDLYELKRE